MPSRLASQSIDLIHGYENQPNMNYAIRSLTCRNLYRRRTKKGIIADFQARRRRKASDSSFCKWIEFCFKRCISLLRFACSSVEMRFFVKQLLLWIPLPLSRLESRQWLPLKLPSKRERKVTCAPCKKSRTSSLKDTSLTDARSLLVFYWTTVSDWRGDIISIRRSHRLCRSWAITSSQSCNHGHDLRKVTSVLVKTSQKGPIRCAEKQTVEK